MSRSTSYIVLFQVTPICWQAQLAAEDSGPVEADTEGSGEETVDIQGELRLYLMSTTIGYLPSGQMKTDPRVLYFKPKREEETNRWDKHWSFELN
ncbi:unnamed protein product [Heligmosomoides polygyrus]|uniref:PH domain-containing protein n=1 Tax=Heligmosomoides polygyrus TaxID=6339 RepID=A0A183FV83_HELPZ|nr:unnamed protein product [Heligmosomoides polygyrus]